MKRLLMAWAIVLASVPFAQASTVLTSIKPIQFITIELTKDVIKPEVLLGANTSPHDYALRPSDVKRLRDAKLVIWFGNDLEPFLTKVLEEQKNVLTISEIEGLKLREFDDGDHDHHGHDHGSHDPHFWLGYQPTLQVAEAIAAALIQIDETNAEHYSNNLKAFKARFSEMNRAITQQLKPVIDSGYYVFHDAYGYFEHDYSLNKLGHFTVSPERKPGAKTLIKIRNTLAEGKANCVFSEPQFTPAVVESVTRGSNATIGVLDPLGVDVEGKVGGYFEFMQNIADSYENCLTQ